MVWERDKERYINDEKKLGRHQSTIMAMVGVPKENKDAIIRFDTRLQCSFKTRIEYMVAFKCFLKHVPNKPFGFFERDDFNHWLKVLEKGYKPSTSRIYIDKVERLFRFVLDLDDGETIRCMKGIKRPRIDHREREQRLAQNILDKSEILQMIRMTSKPKYRAMVATIFDGALRKSEFLNIYIKEDLIIHDDYIELKIRNGKGGKSDTIILVDSVPYIKAWLSEHPFYDGDNTPQWTPLWTKERNPLYEIVEVEGKSVKRIFALSKWVVEWLLIDLAKKAGIKKKIWPHLTRHSKISSMINDEGYTLPEAQYHARHRTVSSTLTYLHLKKDNLLKNKMLEKAGKLKIKEEIKENPFKVISCPRCEEENAPSDKFCSRCGWDFSKNLKQTKMKDDKDFLAKEFLNFATESVPEFKKGMEIAMKMFLEKEKT